MVNLTEIQQKILYTDGHLLVTGGPGSGKTTVSILKAAKIARDHLRPSQKILFLSFARATVSRVLEAIDEERQISAEEKSRIEVDTYHSFFWRILKAHGYLVGFPRRVTILTPSNEAIALSTVRSGFKANSKLTDIEKAEKCQREDEERLRLAQNEGMICFNLFADRVGTLLHGAEKIRKLVSTMYPFIILDEFQDTSADQWRVVKALGQNSTLIALADPEQRIFDFIGADPARLDHFKAAFFPTTHDLSTDNHRSNGTEIAVFGNDILTGKFRQREYLGVDLQFFESNSNQAFSTLIAQTLKARTRLIKTGKKDWSLAILVPTKKMTRLVSDALRDPPSALPAIAHTAAVDMEGPVLAAEVIAFLMQPSGGDSRFEDLVNLLCSYYYGKGGDTPSKKNMDEATRLRTAYQKLRERLSAGKPPPGNSILLAVQAVYSQACAIVLTGNPDADWIAIRAILEQGPCPRLKNVADEVRNVRLLERGTQLRQALAQDWRDYGAYQNALPITRQSFVQEHFAMASKPESGVIVMNMHKAKGKQFDEVIIFEGWPFRARKEIVANPNRIVLGNSRASVLNQARQNFRVSVTRAKIRTTILTPNDDICVLLLPEN